MRFISLIFLFVLFFSCKKTKQNSIDLGTDYYPVSIGNWIEYDVDSITFSDFTTPTSIDTSSFKIKETVESSFLDLNDEENFRVEEFKKNDSTSWQINNIFSLKKSNINIEKVENDLRYIKLVFPPEENKTWDGNIYIDVVDQPLLDFLNPDKYAWEYTYSSIDENLVVGTYTFDSCVTIIQIDEENLFEKKYSKEIYAKNVGLVYKELIILETQAPPSSASFLDRAENGFVLKYTISDYNY